MPTYLLALLLTPLLVEPVPAPLLLILSDVDRVNDDTLLPIVLHHAGDLLSSIITDKGADKVQASIDASCDTAACYDTETTKLHVGATSVALTACVALLPGVAALASDTLAAGAAVIDVWVLVKVGAEIEACVVDDVALLHDICTLSQIALGNFLAEILEFDEVVWVCSCRHALENALLCQEQTGRADAHECTLALGVLFLSFGIGLDHSEQAIGLGVALEDGFGAFETARDDDYIPLSNALLGLCDIEVCSEGSALGGNDVL